MYSAPDTEHDFAKFSAILDGRLQSGNLTKTKSQSSQVARTGWAAARLVVAPESKPSKPWWKLW